MWVDHGPSGKELRCRRCLRSMDWVHRGELAYSRCTGGGTGEVEWRVQLHDVRMAGPGWWQCRRCGRAANSGYRVRFSTARCPARRLVLDDAIVGDDWGQWVCRLLERDGWGVMAPGRAPSPSGSPPPGGGDRGGEGRGEPSGRPRVRSLVPGEGLSPSPSSVLALLCRGGSGVSGGVDSPVAGRGSDRPGGGGTPRREALAGTCPPGLGRAGGERDVPVTPPAPRGRPAGRSPTGSGRREAGPGGSRGSSSGLRCRGSGGAGWSSPAGTPFSPASGTGGGGAPGSGRRRGAAPVHLREGAAGISLAEAFARAARRTDEPCDREPD